MSGRAGGVVVVAVVGAAAAAAPSSATGAGIKHAIPLCRLRDNSISELLSHSTVMVLTVRGGSVRPTLFLVRLSTNDVTISRILFLFV